MESDVALIGARNLVKQFPLERSAIGKVTRLVSAVDGVSLDVMPGETLGVVGESGSGKSTLGRLLLSLERPTSGDVLFKGDSLLALKRRDLRLARRHLQLIFQDPLAALDPRFTVEEAIGEPLRAAGAGDRRFRRERVRELLGLVGLDAGKESAHPRDLSGGQRQRVVIARAIAVEPQLIVADEPVSALDVSVQAQIVNLLRDLQQELGMAYLFISHDLAVVRHIADRVAVMYLGRLVEMGNAADVLDRPVHPYTSALRASIARPDPSLRSVPVEVNGDSPSVASVPSGCAFRTRCPFARQRCADEMPLLRDVGGGRMAACHFAEELHADRPTELVLRG